MIEFFFLIIWSWVFSQRVQYILFGGSIFAVLWNLPIGSFFSNWIFDDFISYVLILLTIYVIILIKLISGHSPLLSFLIVLLTLDLCLVFTVDNILLFCILFEFSLIPISLMILGWGFQPERLTATLYILFYTITTSFPFLALVVILETPSLSSLSVLGTNYNWLTLFALLPFLVKLPIFIAHLWLPKAHVEAPAFGSMVLAAVLLKLGSFGLWRLFSLFGPVSIIIAAFSLFGGGVCAILVNMQTDVKAIIAYSRVVHIGLISFSLIFYIFEL